jgi:hypothetical protein
MAIATAKVLMVAAAAGLGFVLTRKSGPSNPTMTKPAHDAVFEWREVDGKLVRFFKPDMAGVAFQVMHGQNLVPKPPPSALAGAAFFEASGVSAEPGLAPKMIKSAVDQGLMVLGSLMLPFPSKQGRFVAMAGRQRLHVANPSSDWAVLVYGPPGTPLPGRKVGGPPGDDEGADIVLTPPELGDNLDADLPPSVRAMIQPMLDDPDIDPWALDDAAAIMTKKGYPKTAAALRQRAKQRRTEWATEDSARGYSEHLIRSGDLAYNMALHYTEDGSRWLEIPKLDPRISTKNGQPHPWHGKVRIPLSWAIWDKRPPPVAHGSLPDSDLEELADELDDADDDENKVATLFGRLAGKGIDAALEKAGDQLA